MIQEPLAQPHLPDKHSVATLPRQMSGTKVRLGKCELLVGARIFLRDNYAGLELGTVRVQGMRVSWNVEDIGPGSRGFITAFVGKVRGGSGQSEH